MVYFPSPDEQRHIERGLLPKLRKQGIAEDLRGWSWQRPPLAPVYDHALRLSDIASGYCATGRDVYLRHVERTTETTNQMVRGQALHALLAGIIERAKQIIYAHRAECLGILEEQLYLFDVAACGARLDENTLRELAMLREFEARRITQRVADVLAGHRYLGADTLASLALPVSVELKLDGQHLGLTRHLAADAVSFPSLTIFDVKFGRREEFHRLGTAGYALVLESLFEVPFDLGCVVYVRFSDGRLLIERDYHIIHDELRQVFIEQRDEKDAPCL
jgi:CRISPR-associated protein Csa1